MLSPLSCRSLICPKLDFTVKSFPRNFWIVPAFAGDSTITRLLSFMPIPYILPISCHFGERMCKVRNKPGNFPNFVATFVVLFIKI